MIGVAILLLVSLIVFLVWIGVHFEKIERARYGAQCTCVSLNGKTDQGKCPRHREW